MLRRLTRGLFGGRTWYTRWFRRGVVAFSGFLLLVVVARMVGVVRATTDVEEAVAELDRTDPRWRIADILADREDVPDDQNSVAVIMRAHALLPTKWWFIEPSLVEPEAGPKPRAVAVPSKTLPHGVGLEYRERSEGEDDGPKSSEGLLFSSRGQFYMSDDIRQRLSGIAPDEPLCQSLTDDLWVVRGRYAPVLEELRKTLVMERSQHPIDLPMPPGGPDIKSVVDSRELISVLQLEAYWNIHERRPAETAECLRMMLSVCRSMDSVPFTTAYLVRIAMGSIAVGMVERWAYRCSPGEDDLLQIERLLAREEAEIRKQLSASLVSERALGFDLLAAVRGGEFSEESLRGPWDRSAPTSEAHRRAVSEIVLPRKQAKFLRSMTEIIAASEWPFRQEVEAYGAILAGVEKSPLEGSAHELADTLLSGVVLVAKSKHRSVCRLRSCRACLLAEIFRLRFQRLPKSTEELGSSLGMPVLMDPWTDTPLRWKAVDGQILVYSLGADGIDDGGRFETFSADRTGHDIGFSIPLSKAARR